MLVKFHLKGLWKAYTTEINSIGGNMDFKAAKRRIFLKRGDLVTGGGDKSSKGLTDLKMKH